MCSGKRLPRITILPREVRWVSAEAIRFGDGIKPFLDFFSQTFKDNPQYSAKIYRSAVNGDLVYVHVKYQNNPQDRGTASVDIYRVNDQGKITEHWDVNQDVPEKSANDNTMF